MDWTTYRALCDRGDVVSRWLLEHTVLLLEGAGEAELARRLRAVPESVPPLPRPADHRGGPEADFFAADLDAGTVAAVAAVVRRLAAEPERRLPGGRGLGGMSEAWGEYAAWLDGTHPRSPRRGDA